MQTLAVPLVLLALAAAPPPATVAEVVVNAMAREDPLPGPVKSFSVRWPHTTTVRFTIDKVGRVRDVTFEAADVPSDIRNALAPAVERWRFWPAVGACRYLEQTASVTVTFDETRVSAQPIEYAPTVAAGQRADGFAWLFPADAGDRRGRARSGPAGIVEPVALKQPPPRFPANASRKAEAGYAFVLVDVDATGKPTRVVASDAWSSDPKLAKFFAGEAVNAVKQWRFLPAKVGATPVARQACQRFLFNMNIGA